MKENNKSSNTKGFTLAELLIVVAIIAVLVAIAIPIFTGQLEKSREATDLANVRSAYAEVMVAAISEDKSSAAYQSDGQWSATVDLVQRKDGWTTKTPLNIGGVESAADGGTNAAGTWIGLPEAKGTCEVSYSASDGIKFIWSGSSGGGSSSGGDGGGSGSGDTGVDKIKANAKPYPTTEGFDGTKGDVYSYNGGYYVCGNTQYYAEGGSPDNWYQWQFIQLDEDATVLTNADLTSPWGNDTYVFTHVERGMLYTDGTDYYIRTTTNDNANTPDKDASNWVKIN